MTSDNGKFQQYMQNFNRRIRYSGATSTAKVDQSAYQFTEFYRDSRHAFGYRFQTDDKKTTWAEWAFCLIGIACGIVSIILMAGQA